VLALGAQKILIIMGNELSFMKMLYCYSTSQMAKYVPGNIWQFVGRGLLYKQNGIKTDNILISILMENIFLLGSALLVSLFLLWFGNAEIGFLDFKLYIIAIFVILFIIFFKSERINKIKVNNKFMETIIILYNVSIAKRLQTLALFIIAWLSFGLSFYLLLRSMGIGNINLSVSGGYFIFSWLVGYLAFLVPGGIGVREYILVKMLANYTIEPIAFTISLVSRVSWFIVELMLFVFTITNHKKIKFSNWD
jgi:uncharacterized membrane protein YbhN (UPF0104 family)